MAAVLMRRCLSARADLDVTIDADAARTPFVKFHWLDRQSLRGRSVDVFKQCASREAEPAA